MSAKQVREAKAIKIRQKKEKKEGVRSSQSCTAASTNVTHSTVSAQVLLTNPRTHRFFGEDGTRLGQSKAQEERMHRGCRHVRERRPMRMKPRCSRDPVYVRMPCTWERLLHQLPCIGILFQLHIVHLRLGVYGSLIKNCTSYSFRT